MPFSSSCRTDEEGQAMLKRNQLLVAFFLGWLVASPLLAAPAPLPRHKRNTPTIIQESELDKAIRKLEQLRVVWRKEQRNGQVAVVFTIARLDRRGGMGGTYYVTDNDLAKTLRRIADRAEMFLAMPR